MQRKNPSNVRCRVDERVCGWREGAVALCVGIGCLLRSKLGRINMLRHRSPTCRTGGRRHCCDHHNGCGPARDRSSIGVVPKWEYANLWGSLRICCGCPVVVRGAEAGIAMTEGVFERIVQHGCSHVEEGLHRRPVPAPLLFLVHTLGHDLVDRTLHKSGRDRLAASTPGSVMHQRRPCCTDQGCGRSCPYPVCGQAMRTEIGRPSSSMRLRAWTATSTSVARRLSVRERSPSPMTCLNLPMAASARARLV